MKTTTLPTLAFATALALAAAAAAQTKPVGPPAPARPGLAATVGGQPIELSAVDELIRPQLMELKAREQQLRDQALEVLIAQALIEQEAKARGTSAEALDKAEVQDKAAVTPVEAKAFYDANRARFGSAAEADALKQIATGLGQQRANERRLAFAQELRAKYPVALLLEPWRVAIETAGAPSRGSASAPVTIVEFSDFQCPFCVRARPSVKRVREAYGDKVRFVFRHFPLDFHAQAQKAGEAAACAGDQGKFWEMHDTLWANTAKLGVSDLKAHAAALGLDAAAFDKCLDSGAYAALLAKDEEAGRAYGVSGTPAFFVNGRPLVGAQPFEAFQQVIDDELRRAGSAPGASAAAR